MGSSSLNAEVNAFERLQIVRGPEFLVLRLEVQVMYGAGEVFGSFESALDGCLVDDHLGGDVRQLTSLPGFHLLSHGLKVSLRSQFLDSTCPDEIVALEEQKVQSARVTADRFVWRSRR